MIRWICERCARAWLYPVERCLHCKLPVRKQRSNVFIVKSKTKVNITSPTNPKAPYYVLLLEDEHKNLFPKKSFIDYNIGETYKFKKGNVSMIKIKYDLLQAIRFSLDSLDSFPTGKPVIRRVMIEGLDKEKAKALEEEIKEFYSPEKRLTQKTFSIVIAGPKTPLHQIKQKEEGHPIFYTKIKSIRKELRHNIVISAQNISQNRAVEEYLDSSGDKNLPEGVIMGGDCF